MDWMNQPQQKNLQQSAEEFLLGKEVGEDHKPLLQPVHKEEFTNDKCEDFIKVHDDPLF